MYRDKKQIAIITMVIAIVVMAIGYAAFSTSLNINGTASIDSDWNVYISNVVVDSSYGKAANGENSPTYEGLTASMNVDVNEPGDWIKYKVTVTNGGSLDAIIDNVKATNLGTSAIVYNLEGIENGAPLDAGKSIDFYVNIEYDKTIVSQPDSLHKTLILDISCVQDINQSVEGGDININEATLTTLSGNNSLTLNNTFPSKLANYKITGNSVQNGTPTPDAPIEIQSVGEKTSNLIPYPYSNGTISTSGVTWTVNGDRSVSCNGTPTAYSAFIIMNRFPITGGKTYAFNLGLDGEFANIALNITQYDSAGNSLGAIDLSARYNKNQLLSDILIETNANTKTISVSVKRNDNNIETYAKFLPRLEEGTKTTNYEPYGYKIPVTVGGKNVLSEQTLIDHGFVRRDDGSLWVKYASTPYEKVLYVNEDKISGSMSISFYLKNVVAGSNYPGCYPYIIYTDGTAFTFFSNSVVASMPSEFSKVEYTTPDDKTIDYIKWAYFTGATETYIKDMQFAWGNDLEYEPYVEPTKTNIYLDEPLRCVGNSCDYIDFASGVVMRQTKKIVFNGTESWIKFSNKNLYYIHDEELLYKGSVYSLSDKYKGQVSGGGGDHGNGDIWLQSIDTYPRIYIYDDNYTTVSAFKSHLVQNNVTGYFPLAIAKPQSIELPEIYIPQGNVKLSVNSNGLTIPIEVSYYQK